MIIILFIFLTTVFAGSYEKYIELLPEEEKQEFLEKIARRIMENIQSKENKERFSRELSDDQLKEHNEFVESILKEETEQMMKNNTSAAENSKNEEENNSEGNTEMKSIKLDRDDVQDEENVDLTVNRRNNDDEGAIEDSTEPNQDIPIQKRSDPTDGNDSITDEVKETVEEVRTEASKDDDESTQERFGKKSSDIKDSSEIQTKSDSNASVRDNSASDIEPEKKSNEKTTVNASGEKSNSLSCEEAAVKPGEDSNSDSKENSTDKPSAENSNSASNEKTTVKVSAENSNNDEDKIQSTEGKFDIIPTRTTTDSDSQTQINDFEVETEKQSESVENSRRSNVDGNHKTTVNYTTESNININSTKIKQNEENSTQSSVSIDEGTTELIAETTYKTITKTISNFDDKNSPDVTENSIDKTTTENIQTLTESPVSTVPELKGTQAETTTENSPNIMNLVSKTDPSIDMLKYLSLKTKTKLAGTRRNGKETLVDKAVKNAVSNFRKFSARLDSSIKRKNELKSPDIVMPDNYEVHEIPENQAPFVEKPSTSIEQPHFAPIYNYSPDNAFYNPRNGQGPNIVEENTIETENLRNRNDNKKPEFLIDLYEMVGKLNAAKKEEANARARIEDDKRNEEKDNKILLPDMPVPEAYNLGDGLKSHIRGVRTALFIDKQIEKTKKDSNEVSNFENADRNLTYSDNFVIVNPDDVSMKKDKRKPMIMNLIDINKSLNNGVYSKTDGKALRMNIIGKKGKRNDAEQGVDEYGNAKLTGNYDTIAEILQLADEGDVFVVMEHLQQLGLPITRRANSPVVSYMSILKDLLKEDSVALKRYDWLATTVEIQSSILKIQELIRRKRDNMPIHPSDVQILKYIVFLHNFATQFTEANSLKNKLRKKYLLPRNKNRKNSSRILKEKGLLHRPWLYLRTLLPNLNDKATLERVEGFINDVEDRLFDLHRALSSLTAVTTYKHQNWYANLKDLYITENPETKVLRELLLHMSVVRLIELIENSCKKGLEYDFIDYMKRNKKEAKSTLEEMIFVLKLVNDAKNDLTTSYNSSYWQHCRVYVKMLVVYHWREKMTDDEDSYCRLCAEPTPKQQLIEPDGDVGLNSKIAAKMSWINVDISTTKTLPDSICFSCFDLLERTWSFLHNVRTAQAKLNKIFLKKTVSDDAVSDAKIDLEVGVKPVNEDWEDFVIKQEVKPEIEVQIETVDPNSLIDLTLGVVKTERLSIDDDHLDSDGMNSTDSDVPLYVTAKKKKVRKKKNFKAENDSDLLNDVECLTWDDYMCRCPDCDAQCKNIVSLRLHSLQIHSHCCTFKCSDCGKVLSSYRSFTNHARTHKKNLRYCCEFCNKTFISTMNLKSHKNSSHKDAYSTICHNCGATFENSDLLRDHLNIYARNNQKRIKKQKVPQTNDSSKDLKCKLCNKEFKSRTSLHQHKTVHTERSRDFACHVCGKMFFTKGTLTTHLMTHEDAKRYKCEFCPMAFHARGNLHAHISLHSGAKPFVCEQCGKSFRAKRHLKSHSIVHTDLKPYSCNYCSKTFRFKTRLNLHLRQHTGAKPYNCVYCQRDFTNGSNYKKHMRRKHNIDTSSRRKYENDIRNETNMENSDAERSQT
ncbi:uncharacterized protein LOC142984356 [Anticarsia gemmatalis]|uniref:uncharacterized protein LOC142984356 n=1 Tax=Anticarsia gemmatalis TaxID=129554 RepID=UPI003F774EC2